MILPDEKPESAEPRSLGSPPSRLSHSSSSSSKSNHPPNLLNNQNSKISLRKKVLFAQTDEAANRLKPTSVEDLIYLALPIREDSVIRALQTRFLNQKYLVSMKNFRKISIGSKTREVVGSNVGALSFGIILPK